MTLKIAGKADLNQLLKQKKYHFSSYELYLNTINDFNAKKVEKLKKRIKIISVHQPVCVLINNKKKEFNLLNPSYIGIESFKVFKETVKRAYLMGIKKVVLHGAKYNYQKSDENSAIEKISVMIKKIEHNNLITLETDLLWFNTFTEKEKPLIVSEEIIAKIINKTSCKITLDFEHFFITKLYLAFLEKKGKQKSPALFEKKFNSWIKKNTKYKIDKIYFQLSNFVDRFKREINHFHLNGTDWYNYFLSFKPPLVGEHLPLGYNKDVLKDRFDYSRIIKELKKNELSWTVLEIGVRKKEYDFFKEMTNSKNYLLAKLKNEN